MSRTKKSRKPSAGSASVPKPKESKAELAKAVPRKPKNKKGKPAGSRQQEVAARKGTQTQGSHNKDPRIGNKTPIDLGGKASTAKAPAVKAQDAKTTPKNTSPIAAIRGVEPLNNIAQEIERIENDPKLLAIVDKQDENISLTADEVDYYNTQMERHQTLSDELGDDDEDNSLINSPRLPEDEDELWDKFDNSDLSKFE